MAECNTSDGISKPRAILGDLTNCLAKRRTFKMFDINDKDVVKRIRVSPRPCTEINSFKGNVISSMPKIHCENQETVKIDSNSDNGDCLKGKNVVLGNSKLDAVSKSGNKLEIVAIDLVDSCREIDYSEDERVRTVNSIALKVEDCGKLDISKTNAIVGNCEVFPEREVVDIEVNDELGESIPVEPSRALTETCEAKMMMKATQNDINSHKVDVDDCNIDSFVLSQSGSFDCTILPDSQESRVFGADRSNELKGDECAHKSGGIDSINTCSCSFCTKAAHIWLDLNYQDIKARVSAMKKSQKEASLLAVRSEKQGGESFIRIPKLESHLMYQWRSLFQNMASIWQEEANQLEANLLPLTDLRDKCKNDLETINAEKH